MNGLAGWQRDHTQPVEWSCDDPFGHAMARESIVHAMTRLFMRWPVQVDGRVMTRESGLVTRCPGA